MESGVYSLVTAVSKAVFKELQDIEAEVAMKRMELDELSRPLVLAKLEQASISLLKHALA